MKYPIDAGLVCSCKYPTSSLRPRDVAPRLSSLRSGDPRLRVGPELALAVAPFKMSDTEGGMGSTFVGGLLVEGVDDPEDIVSHVSIDIAGPASEKHSGEEGASPCAASASDATGKSVVTAEDLAALEERVSTLLHVHSNEFRAVDARVAQLEQAKLGELMAQAAADCAKAAAMASETMRAATEVLEFVSNSDYIQGEIETHARNAALSIKSVVQDTVAEIEKDVRRVAKKR